MKLETTALIRKRELISLFTRAACCPPYRWRLLTSCLAFWMESPGHPCAAWCPRTSLGSGFWTTGGPWWILRVWCHWVCTWPGLTFSSFSSLSPLCLVLPPWPDDRTVTFLVRVCVCVCVCILLVSARSLSLLISFSPPPSPNTDAEVQVPSSENPDLSNAQRFSFQSLR